MAASARRRLPYWARFVGLAGLSLGVLGIVVFAVFPQRFVLAPGLREQGLNFPVEAPDFESPARPALLRPPAPPAGAPASGPAERFWSTATALVEAGRDRAALPVFRGWLEDHPGDHGARLEYARALERAGRLLRAEEAYRRVAEATGGRSARLALARVRWRLGDLEGALAVYDALAGERPDLVAALGRRRAAAPGGRAETALPAADTVRVSTLARARAAAAGGDLRRAAELYRAAVLLRPGDETARLELARLLATRLDAPERAAAVLEAFRPRAGARPSPGLRRRLARYRHWAGDDAGALRALEALAAEGAATAGDLALLGDLLRWRGRRAAAADRYAAALALEPDHRRALEGRRILREATQRIVEARDPARAGVESDLYLDSGDYRSWGVAGRAVLDPGWRTHRVVARSGVRSVRGRSLSGPLREEAGPVGEIGWIAWWRQATVRTALRVGAERLEPAGTEPTVAAELSVPKLGLEAAVRHGLAHPTTLTFASLQQATRIDRVEASLYRALGGGPWGLWTSAEAASVRGGGVDNGRFVAQATLDRPVALGGRLRAGYATRLLTTDRPAPTTGAGLPAYWSPGLSWSHGLSLRLEGPGAGEGWGWHARLQPGASAVRLHGAGEETELEFNLYGEGGLEYRSGRTVARLEADYVRSRLDGYEALGGSLALAWRF